MSAPLTTGNHSFQNYDGWSRYKTPATILWGAGGVSLTIADPKISTNSIVIVQVTGATPAAGSWSYAVTVGQVVITSSSSESSTLPLSYVIL